MNKKVIMNKKVSPLRKDIITEAVGAYNLYNKYDSTIANRVNYVVQKIASIFGGKIEWWDWSNGGGEVDGHFTPDMVDGETIQLDGERPDGGEWVALLKDEKGKFTEEWEFHWFEFPTRFLYEDFEEELKEGIQKYREQEIKKKEMNKQKKLEKVKNKEKLLESVKSNLTKEEKRAVGL
jgi:hypothetical protein